MQKIKGSEIITESIGKLLKNNGEKDYMTIASNLSIGHIEYNANMNNNYQYKIKRSVICDGTLSFIDDLIFKIMEDLLNQRTYYKPTFPENKKEEIKSIHYIMGDFEATTEYGDFETTENPWLKSRFTVELPVSCEYIFV
ncbi:MAG: hypothetical protein ACRC1T_05650 [Clostridium chrysemydis]|uniref:hypothetical protein n=1 Tax=Clostridium chrysemydis TaxID=2665504 RepID=UPI003F36B042